MRFSQRRRRALVKRSLQSVLEDPKVRAILEDPRMSDTWNPETQEDDGIPYWERPGWKE